MAVKAFLVTYDYNLPARSDPAGASSRESMCQNFDRLQAEGHPKWKEVSLAMPQLGQGWSYYAPTASELARCAQRVTKPVKVCTTEQKILGLCE